MGGKKKGWASAFTSLFVETVDEGGAARSSGGGGGDIDIEALLRETSELTGDLGGDEPPPAPSAPSAPSPRTTAVPADLGEPAPAGLKIGQPLKELYQIYGVPASPKAVEEIILFLQGLRGMPQNVQNTALKAMDDADPNWSIADVILDGRYKVDALRKAKGAVDQQVETARMEASAEVEAQEAYLAEAQGTIKEQIEALHAQIAELMELQQAEEMQVQERKAAALGRITSLEQQALAEHKRIETEIERITQIVSAFGPLAEEP